MTQTYIGCVERTEIWDECASYSQMYAHKHTIVDCRSLSLSLLLSYSLYTIADEPTRMVILCGNG